MATHLLRIAGATSLILLCTFLPFLPGRYDSLAVPLSLMAQVFGKVGLLLVPVGALWLISEYRPSSERRRYGFAIAALIASSIVWIIVSVAALSESFALGAGILALGSYVLLKLRRRLRLVRSSAIPLYLLVIPAAVALLQLAIARPMTDFSRNRAIANSAPLIAGIERYRAIHGRYPPFLIGLWPDYWPGIIGIPKYHYGPAGNAYNLFFEQPTFRLGTREIVVYNPRGEHTMTSHTLDLLELTPEQLAMGFPRGHYAVHDAPQPHWKYFWFD